MSTTDTKASFFRQSGWMVIATVGGGAFMTAVHTVAAKMGPGEYGVFATLLKCLILLNIPAGALQTVFTQQAAAAQNEDQTRRLAGTVRAVLVGIFALWLALLVPVFFFQQTIRDTLKISTEAVLWMTMAVALTSLWTPVIRGLLQGRQNFMGLGWVAVFDGVGRFLAVCLLVGWLGGQSASGMLGAVIGQVVALAAGVWWTWQWWNHRGSAPDWRAWLRQVVPLTVGTGAVTVLMTTDVVFVQSVFAKEQTPFYIAPSMIGFALMQFTVPLAVVMYPKIVRSAATAQKTDALKLTLIATGVLGVLAALASMLLPELPLRILYLKSPELWKAAPLVPWFAWCMVSLTLANVLIGNLLARERFAIVPWLAVLAAAYVFTLLGLREYFLGLERDDAFRRIVQILTSYNLLAFALSLWFTWGKGGRQGATAKAGQGAGGPA